ncbi:MAG: SIS domain-containing protein [Phycisphaerae bacterium]|nr:SIS domain-containing protein [Phycisphaerae bacterium]
MLDRIKLNIAEHLDTIAKMQNDVVYAVLTKIADAIIDSIRGGGKILIAGNGGSAADAQHIAGEFIGRYLYDRHPLPAIALSTDTSVMTCVANDYTYDDVFVRQVRALVKREDVFWAISTSGNSKNILLAAQAAIDVGARVIAFCGGSGGKLGELTPLCFISGHTRTNRIQEAHLLAYHIVCELMEAALCPKEG